MLKVIALFAVAAALIHVLFFCLESLWWTRPSTRATFRLTEEESQTTRQLAFNQGFYNLFLAVGMLIGLFLMVTHYPHVGLILVFWNALSMLGAAIVLLVSSPKMLRGALIQGLAPLLLLLCVVLSRYGA
jgi:putative membrane protein